MFVPVPGVLTVAVAAVDEVDVVAVEHFGVAAASPVLVTMIVIVVGAMDILTLIPMATVFAVRVTVVQIVDVVLMLDGGVATAGRVGMHMQLGALAVGRVGGQGLVLRRVRCRYCSAA